MMSRIENAFYKNNRKALIPFIVPGVCGAPVDEIVCSLVDNGADIVEIGIPFSDPVADGPTIQRAGQMALNNGMNTDIVFDMVAKARSKSDVPLVLLVYYNTIFKYGNEKFVEKCLQSGIDGLIVPELPFEERAELDDVIAERPIDLITLAAPTSGDRLKKILPPAKGFIYCVSKAGVTGERSELSPDLKGFMIEVKAYTDKPRAIGFGISSPDMVKSVKAHCEGVIVGSALVRRLLDEDVKSAMDFIYSLRKAL